MARRSLPILIVLAVAASACGGDTGAQAPSSPATSAPSTSSPSGSSGARALPLADVHLGLRKIATLDSPIAMAVRPDDPSLYVAEKTGRVVAIRDGRVSGTVLDLTGRVSLGGEQGLLGIAFSPDGRYLYADYTDTQGDTHVTQWTWGSAGAEPNSARGILFVQQPYSNHNGGQIAFGPDGDLYVALGDGGSGGDPHHNGQNLGTMLGKLLRIEPTPGGPRPYQVPGDNPFVGRPGARPEIWAYGLRNPWRFTFDRTVDDLWIGDVGQNEWEEIDYQPAGSAGGQNYGWGLTEGDHSYEGNTPPPNWTRPVFEYSHATGGCAVVGGYVYRGRDVRGLWGAYLFSDNCSGGIAALRLHDGRVVSERGMGLHVSSPSSFGQDARGELYLMSLEDGGIYRLVNG